MHISHLHIVQPNLGLQFVKPQGQQVDLQVAAVFALPNRVCELVPKVYEAHSFATFLSESKSDMTWGRTRHPLTTVKTLCKAYVLISEDCFGMRPEFVILFHPASWIAIPYGW